MRIIHFFVDNSFRQIIDVRFLFGYAYFVIQTTQMTHSLSMSSRLPQTIAVSRIKTYTRKLAEIERFIETLGATPIQRSEPDVTIHTYWQ